MSDYTAAVLAGASLLDEKKPGWYNNVDLNTLNVNHVYSCPLGQLFGTYSKGLNALFGQFDRPEDGAPFGFFIKFEVPKKYDSSYTWGEYQKLTEEWKEQINARL